MDLYVKRHDGTAATCDDFVAAMQDASGVDLSQFKLWYSTAGTPVIEVNEVWDADAARLTVNLSQHTPDTAGQKNKPALHIPLKLGLLDRSGAAIPLTQGRVEGDSTVLDFNQRSMSFEFDNLNSRPVVSMLRGFSAPVKMVHDTDDSTLAFLMANDPDSFNRWEAGQRLAQRLIEACLAGKQEDSDLEAAIENFSKAIADSIEDTALEPAFVAEVLSLPTLDTLAENQSVIDVVALERARQRVVKGVARSNQAILENLAADKANGKTADAMSALAMGQRRLRNTALALLANLDKQQYSPLLAEQYAAADNMTDRLAALRTLCHGDSEQRTAALADFHKRFSSKRLVIDKWFSVQAGARRTQIMEDVLSLARHPDFEMNNPNRARSLIGGFVFGNPIGFHSPDGSGYRWAADQVLALDKTNPQIAASLVSPLGMWRRFEASSSALMKQELQRIRDSGSLSSDVFELVSKSLVAL